MRQGEKARLNLQKRRKDFEEMVKKLSPEKVKGYTKPGSLRR